MRSVTSFVLCVLCSLVAITPGCKRHLAGHSNPAARKETATWTNAYHARYRDGGELSDYSYNSISVVSPSLLFVAADYIDLNSPDDRIPFILKSSDGGNNWTEIPLGDKPKLQALNAVYFLNQTIGWAVGLSARDTTVVYKTTDGGKSWTATETPYKESPTSVFFIDANTGWVGGATSPEDSDVDGPSDLLMTSNGGASWTAAYHLPCSINSIFFPDAQNGWAGGNPLSIYHTSNGGRTWDKQRTGFEPAGTPQENQAGPVDLFINSVDFVDISHGWAVAMSLVSNESRVLGTADGGATWSVLWAANEQIHDVHFINQREGWAVSDKGGYVYHTTDGGGTWPDEAIKTPVRISLSRVGAADAAHVWAVGGGAILKRISG